MKDGKVNIEIEDKGDGNITMKVTVISRDSKHSEWTLRDALCISEISNSVWDGKIEERDNQASATLFYEGGNSYADELALYEHFRFVDPTVTYDITVTNDEAQFVGGGR